MRKVSLCVISVHFPSGSLRVVSTSSPSLPSVSRDKDAIRSASKSYGVKRTSSFSQAHRSLLRRLMWRAKETLLEEIPTSPRVSDADDAARLFTVDWAEKKATADLSLSSTNTDSAIAGGDRTSRRHLRTDVTLETSLTLLCELLILALRGRPSSVAQEFVFADMKMALSPVKAPQAVTTPLTRQARLWTELREWQSLVACAAVTFRRMQTESSGAESLRSVVVGLLEKLESLAGPRHGSDKSLREADRSLCHTLWRLALLYRVLGAILRDESTRAGAETAVHVLACELERTVFPAGLSARSGEQLRGVPALLSHAFLRRSSAQRGGQALDEALHAFLSAYVEALPLLSRAPSGDAEAPGAAFVRVLRESWVAELPAVRSGGSRVAMWWLRLVPVLLDTFLSVTAQLGEGKGEKEPTEILQTELVSTLCAMLYFDEESFEKQRMQSIEAISVQGAHAERNGDEEAKCVRPRRGGRSLFKKGADGGVLLPSSTDAAPKTTRFTSRRVWTAQGENSDKDSRLSGDVGVVNSPLFDVIVCTRDTIEQLLDVYAVDQIGRSDVLEGTWLALLAAHRRTREAFAPPREEHTNVPWATTSSGTASTSTKTSILPSFVLASVWHLSCALGVVTREVCEISGSTFIRDENVKRAVSLVVVAGTQEVLLQNCFYMDGLMTNWWLLGGLFGSHKAVQSLDSAVMFLVSQRQRLKCDPVWLRASTETVLSCLNRGSLFLSPGAKQWGGAFVVSNLLTAMRAHSDGVPEAKNMCHGASQASTEVSHESTWMGDAMQALLTAFSEDKELLLFSCSASFLDLFYDLRRMLPDDVMINFAEKVLLESMLPALVTSLAKSADEDDTETHASACEAALLVIAELTRFTPRLFTKPAARSGRKDEMIMSAALYCLRFARRAGGRPTYGSGLSPPQLPNVEIPIHAGAAIAQLLQRGNRRSYLHVLDLGNAFVSPPRAAPLYFNRMRGSLGALSHYAQGTHPLPVSQHSKVVGEAVKFLDVLMEPQVTRVMGSLVRFMENYMRQWEVGARVVADKSRNATLLTEKYSHMKAHKNKKGRRQEKEEEIRRGEEGEEKEKKGAGVSTVDRLEDAPFLLLDLMSHLSAAGTWSTVFWAFNVAETSLRIHRRHQLTTEATSLKDVATMAILTQLRSLSSQRYNTINNGLHFQIQRVVVCISDAMSDLKVTLLGLDRGTLLQGLLRHTSRGEFRTVFFALKQAVLFVQRVSVQYRGAPDVKESPPFTGMKRAVNAEQGAKEDTNGEGEEDDMDEQLKEGATSTGSHSYFHTTKHTLEEQQALRAFLGTLVVCFHGALDVISSCALQQDVLDEDLRDALMTSLHTLIHVLQGTIRALLDSEDLSVFAEERAAILWISLIVASIVGRVISLDHSRVCFTEQARTSTNSLFKTIEELIDTFNVPSASVANQKTVNTKGSAKKGGVTPLSSSSSSLLLLDTLLNAVQQLQEDRFMSHRVAMRFALTSRFRRDLTVLVGAIRAMASAAARHKPSGNIIHRVWRSVCDELSAKVPPASGKKRAAKTIRAAALTVPSREELSVALVSFAELSNELNETATNRIAQQREADYVLDWACECVASIVSSIGEDPSLLDAEESRDDNHSNSTFEANSSISSSFPQSSSSSALSLVEMEASFILDEDESSGSGTPTSAEIVSAIVRQSSHMLLAAGSSRRLASTHLECVLRALERCTLQEILSAPRGHHVIRSLQSFARAKSPVPADRRTTLWRLLESKWGAELMPSRNDFEVSHAALTQLVRNRRALAHQSDTESSHVSMGPFGLVDNIMARLARVDAPTLLLLSDLPFHDDPGLAKTDKAKEAKHSSTQRDIVSHISPNSLFAMLSLLLAGPRGDAALAVLARTVAMYAAQQHILLRPRTDGQVVNVLGFLQSRAEALSGADGSAMAAMQRCGLPHAALHAESVAGWFLSHKDRVALEALFAGESPRVETTRSTEEQLFDYMRSSCLYLHLVALVVGAAVRHGVFQDASLTHSRRPAVVGESRGNSESHGMASRSAERVREADARIGDSALVSANPLESLLLHFVNVAGTMVSHADSVTHRATSIAIGHGSDAERVRRALLYGDEIRLMVSSALRAAVRALLQDSADGYPLVSRVVHAVIGGFSCDATPTSLDSGGSAQNRRRGDHNQSSTTHSGKSHTRALPISPVAMDACRAKRPELFVRSPTLLCLLDPSFFNDVLAHHMRTAPGPVVTQVVASLHFHLSQKKAQFAQLMTATTTILSNTTVRNAALRLYCDALCAQMVERESFRDALAPPIVTSPLRGSIPNEVLIPFLAAVSREDLGVAKHTLAAALHCAMGLRPDVFGHPPTQDRYAKLSIARRQKDREETTKSGSALPGSLSVSPSSSSSTSTGIHSADRTRTRVDLDDSVGAAVGAREQDSVDALSRFQMDQLDQAATRTHKRALASLNLMLPEAMETAMHFAAMRRLTAEEYRKAMAMIRSADDARRERIEAFRSAAPATALETHSSTVVAAAASHPDASLHLEDPTHFGVALLHVRFALRKIIHVSMRRLAAQQGPRTLCMMFEVLRAVDPKWHDKQGTSIAAANAEQPQSRQSDGMLAGTLRVLMARAMVCAEFGGAGGDGAAQEWATGSVALSFAGLQRAERALLAAEANVRMRGNRKAWKRPTRDGEHTQWNTRRHSAGHIGKNERVERM